MSARSTGLLCLAVAVAAISLVAAGCGGGDSASSASSGGSNLTKAEFINKAEAICDEEREKIVTEFNTYFARHKSSGKSEDELFADLIKEVLLPSVENDIKRLRALGTPAGEEERIDAFLSAQQRGVEEMSTLKTLPKGPAGEKYLEPASRLAKAYGIKHCAQS
jgi:hypothetical protein